LFSLCIGTFGSELKALSFEAHSMLQSGRHV
jgi:hypothetical protein